MQGSFGSLSFYDLEDDMAATATQQILVNGKRNLVLHYTVGGTTGDASAATLVDISALDSSLSATGLRLDKIAWALSGFNAKLSWDADTDVDFAEMTDGEGNNDWSAAGGIQNNAGTGVTGDVNFTTAGYTAAGDVGQFTLYFKKRG